MRIHQLIAGFFPLSLALLTAPVLSSAAPLQLHSETLVGFFERTVETQAKTEATVMPAYEYLRLDYEAEVKGFSFHGYGWGRGDLAGSGYFQDDADGEFLYGYLQYQRPEMPGFLRLGRQQIFAGLTDKIVDGLSVNGSLGRIFEVSAYAGIPLSVDSRKNATARIRGGRLASSAALPSQAGISYQKVESGTGLLEETAGIDCTLGLFGHVEVSGISIWNLDRRDLGELSLEAGFKVTDIHFQPYVRRFQYEDFIASGSASVRPFNYLADSGEPLTVAGLDLDWRKTEVLELGFRGKAVDLEGRDESALYFSTLLIRHGQDLSQAGLEIGLMSGDAAENEYALARAYFYDDNLPERLPLDFITADVVLVRYRQEIYDTDHSFFASIGAGEKILAEAMEIKLSLDYSIDPYFRRDLKGGLVFSYLLP